MIRKHDLNFFKCMRTRQKPVLDKFTGAGARVLGSMAVQSRREGQTLYFGEANWAVLSKMPKR